MNQLNHELGTSAVQVRTQRKGVITTRNSFDNRYLNRSQPKPPTKTPASHRAPIISIYADDHCVINHIHLQFLWFRKINTEYYLLSVITYLFILSVPGLWNQFTSLNFVDFVQVERFTDKTGDTGCPRRRKMHLCPFGNIRPTGFPACVEYMFQNWVFPIKYFGWRHNLYSSQKSNARGANCLKYLSVMLVEMWLYFKGIFSDGKAK